MLLGASMKAAETETASRTLTCALTHCFPLQPHGRLYGVFMAHSNDAGLVTSKQEVTLLAIFSEPLDVLTFRSSSFIIQGPMDAQVISLDKVSYTFSDVPMHV